MAGLFPDSPCVLVYTYIKKISGSKNRPDHLITCCALCHFPTPNSLQGDSVKARCTVGGEEFLNYKTQQLNIGHWHFCPSSLPEKEKEISSLWNVNKTSLGRENVSIVEVSKCSRRDMNVNLSRVIYCLYLPEHACYSLTKPRL